MPAYNFQARFADAVEQGTKRSTIRGREAFIGTTAHLFVGMRTKSCKRLGVHRIIDCKPITLGFKQDGMPRIKLGNKVLSYSTCEVLANSDGFDSPRELVRFFRDTYKLVLATEDGGVDHFKGWLIAWNFEKEAAKP